MSEKATLKLTIVQQILAKFKIGDEGKYYSFFIKLIRDEERAIAQLKHNINAEELTYATEKEKISHQIEDAQEALDSSYLEVNPEEIQNNAKQEVFKDIYWKNIQDAENRLNALKEELEYLEVHRINILDDINYQIEKRQARIARISKQQKEK
jgi:hypothetical protein